MQYLYSPLYAEPVEVIGRTQRDEAKAKAARRARREEPAAVKPPVDPGEADRLIDLGSEHWAVPMYRDGVLFGVDEWHRNQRGEWCSGWVPIKTAGRTDDRYWDLVSEQPLTLSPSLQCTACPSHGWIRDGAWTDA